MTAAAVPDPLDGRRPLAPPGPLAPFAAAGVLQAADVHVAVRLAALTCPGPVPAEVLLGAALAVRAPRLGHVCVDLAQVAGRAATDQGDPAGEPLPWPAVPAWAGALAASPLVAADGDAAREAPLRLRGTLLYLDRYWREERQVAADLRALAADPAPGVEPAALRDGLGRLFGDDAVDQRVAAACGVLRRLAVVCGGPGTGKTTTIARLLALADGQQPGGLRPRLVALAAPTGKAAARLEEAVHEQAAGLPIPDGARARLLALQGTTVHRLLGGRPDSESRFRHDRANRLPHTLVVVDEASMASLSLMARLLEALREDARLVLVGDPDQLASVEAGAVLGDIAGPAREGAVRRPEATRRLERAVGAAVPAATAPDDAPIGDGVAVLVRVHRFGGAIAVLADAVRRGDAAGALGVLEAGHGDVTWIPDDPATAGDAALAPVRAAAAAAGTRLIDLARAGDAAGALAGLGAFRLLCPHRHGPYGVDRWGALAEGWLEPAGALPGAVYPGLPLIVTENDYALRLFNGDTGVVVRREAGPVAAFERAGGLLEVGTGRLAAVEPVHAMTVHKSQGSQFTAVAVVVAPTESAISTRELLYTAVTRARERLVLVGSREAVAAAVQRPVARASGLRAALWASG